MVSYETWQQIKQIFRNPVKAMWLWIQMITRYEQFETAHSVWNLAAGLPDRLYNQYKGEIDYISSCSSEGINASEMFPYGDIKNMPFVESGWDNEVKLPFVIHEGRRFYNLRSFSAERAKSDYCYFVGIEGILGTGIKAKSPHSYVDEGFCVENGDIIVDVGCSDGLFAFANAERANRIYLFEVEKRWMAPLVNSFKPYEKKVVIVNKLVSNRTCGNEVLLSDALANEGDDKTFFIKMDVEGYERDVIRGSEAFLRSHRVKLSCCVYHRQDDAVAIKAMLENMGFKTRFSNGYMLPSINGIHFPYFRHGVIYAQNY